MCLRFMKRIGDGTCKHCTLSLNILLSYHLLLNLSLSHHSSSVYQFWISSQEKLYISVN